MISFPRLRSPRLDVQLRELTIGEAVMLAAIPPGRHERATTALLKSVITEAGGPHQDPARWTVQERMLVQAHYISGISETGANFEIGDGTLMDFLDPIADHGPDDVDAGEACGSQWRIRQLIGAEAEAIEALAQSRFDWMVGDIAARMRVQDPEEPAVPDAVARPHAYSEWLQAQIATIKAMPESEFAEIFAIYRAGLAPLHHLFRLEFDGEGHMVMPKPSKEVGGQMAPARFSVSSCITEVASIMGQ